MIHNKHKTLIIIGAGGHGKVCIDVAKQIDLWEEIKIIDDSKQGRVLNKEIIGTSERLVEGFVEQYDFFVGIGDNKTRKSIMEKLLSKKANIVNLISPHAIVSQYVECGIGNLLMPLSVLNADVRIGNGNIINTSAVVEHDVLLGDYNHLSPFCTILGNASVLNLNWLGASSVIFPGIEIKNEMILGANSIVREHVTDSKSIVVGNSRRII